MVLLNLFSTSLGAMSGKCENLYNMKEVYNVKISKISNSI
jgi:hypothetical protein